MDAVCQRWRSRRSSYRPAGEPIDPRRHGVDLITEARAKAFTIEHHYSGSYPAAVCRVGLFEVGKGGSELVGVAVFGVPVQPKALQVHAGVDLTQGIELCRFVLLDRVPANGESWFGAAAMRLLVQEKPNVSKVLAYCDPVPRETAEGLIVKPGHQGTIYKALNARLAGRSSRRNLLLAPDGRVISGRMLTKLRQGDRGAAYAYRTLLEMGAPKRDLGEGDAAYVARALKEGPWRKLRHPGNLAFVLSPRVRRTRREETQLALEGLV